MTNPVITVDGSSGVGKGSLCKALSEHLKWHLLDSGALYRLVAFGSQKHNIAIEDVQVLEKLALNLDVKFTSQPEDDGVSVVFEGEIVNKSIRNEACGALASKVAAIPEVRAALVERQKNFAQAPGLVADGRDMGTVIFPEAPLKIFLQASAQVRAERRYLQLAQAGSLQTAQFDDKIAALEELKREIEARDDRDMNRSVAPLKPASDAVVIDTSTLNRSDVFEKVLALVNERKLF